MSIQQVYLIRHGETEWSLNKRHTGITDLPLTEHGRNVAKRLKPLLSGKKFELVQTSPLKRARETCELSGLADHAEINLDLIEWNYGEYEGRRTDDGTIGRFQPGVGMAAARLQVPVVPVRLDGLDRILHHKWKFPKRGNARVAFGRPIRLEGTDYADLARQVEEAVRSL